MKQFEIVICRCGSLEVIKRIPGIEAKDVDQARQIGITKYQQTGYFVGAQRISN